MAKKAAGLNKAELEKLLASYKNFSGLGAAGIFSMFGSFGHTNKNQYNNNQSSSYSSDMDPYIILGVSQTSTYDEVKAAWKAKCQEHHPDKGGDVQVMAKINAAWEALKFMNKWENYKNI
jgi:DnaJ-domain-containing protein 1